jgi:acyl-CoA synthetase (NDP forming)
MSQPKKVAEKISEFSKENKNKRVIAFFLGENSVKESWNILKKNRIEIYGRI